MKIAVAANRAALKEVIVHVNTYPGTQILCLDFWAERYLAEQNVSFISGQDLCTGGEEAQGAALAQEIAREWYRRPSLSFFVHDGINIGEVFEPMLEMYLSILFYYTRIFKALKEKYPDAELYIPVLSFESSLAGPLAPFEGRAVYDAACMAGFVLTDSVELTLPTNHLFPRSTLQTFLIHFYNILVSFVPKKTLKIYASEYWSHIAPILAHMPDTELVLMESSELRQIGWRNILKHRIRVRHPGDASRSMRPQALAKGERYKKHWEVTRSDVLLFLESKQSGLVWNPLLTALEYLIAYAPRIIVDIDGLKRIYQQEEPQLIVQRASIGGRLHHFFLMARIAKQLGIPSVELQHAGAIFNPASVHSKLETDYLASYGEVEREEYGKNGYAEERIVSIGSPRLTVSTNTNRDAILQSLGLDPKKKTLLAAVPSELAELQAVSYSSYDIADFLTNLRRVKDLIPELQFICKFRKDADDVERQVYIKEVFPEGGIVSTDLPIQTVISAADIVTSGNSTILYEALINHKLLVLFPWKTWDYNLQVYAPVIPFAHDGKELGELLQRLFENTEYSNEVRQKEEAFLARHSFDEEVGRRSARVFLRIAKQ